MDSPPSSARLVRATAVVAALLAVLVATAAALAWKRHTPEMWVEVPGHEDVSVGQKYVSAVTAGDFVGKMVATVLARRRSRFPTCR